MKEYWLIHAKRLIKNPILKILFLLSIITLVGTYVYHYKVSYDHSLLQELTQEVDDSQMADSPFLKALNRLEIKEDAQTYMAIVKAYKWQADSILEPGTQYDQEIKRQSEKKVAYFDYLAKENLLADYPLPVRSVGFCRTIWEDVLTHFQLLMVLIISIFLLIPDYYQGISIASTLPISRIQQAFVQLVIVLSIQFIFQITLSLISILLARILGGWDSWKTPIIVLTQARDLTARPFIDLVFPAFKLQMITSITIFLSLRLLQDVLKNYQLASFVGPLVIVGLQLLSLAEEKIEAFVHLIPYNYFNGLSIISGSYSQNFIQQYLTYEQGFWVNCVTILLLLLILIFIWEIRKKSTN